MKTGVHGMLLGFAAFLSLQCGISQELYQFPKGMQTRWQSFENRTGEKGKGGMENRSAKGHAMDVIPAGRTVSLLNVEGSGIVRRMWITISDRSSVMLRALKIEAFWDGAGTPAVSAPFGDFFGVGLGRRVPFENEFFSDPEGRSFNCILPMPFHKSARITVTNESDRDLQMIFYDVDYTLSEKADRTALYFHCYWNRENPTTLERDFEILPKVSGKGRFLGMNAGVKANPEYRGSWWGEGEVKVFLDGDSGFPTLCGTGTEDYIGSAWGQGKFANRYQGCPVADEQKAEWAFYRFHVPDPVYFESNCRVVLPQIGGNAKEKVSEMVKAGILIKPISVHNAPVFVKLLEMDPLPDLSDPKLPDGWVNFFRQDDVSATAYFYLDKPENGLPPLAPVNQRVAGMEE
jgi:hypothetical protein